MRIEIMEAGHLEECAAAFVLAHQDENWTNERAVQLLSDLLTMPKFVGFIAYENDHFVGAAFCHVLIGALENRMIIDEFFVVPAFQHSDFGAQLLDIIRLHAAKNDLRPTTIILEDDDSRLSYYVDSEFSSDGEDPAFLFRL